MLAAAAAHAEKRVALVIGNTAYQHTAPLANPSASTGEAGTNRTGPCGAHEVFDNNARLDHGAATAPRTGNFLSGHSCADSAAASDLPACEKLQLKR